MICETRETTPDISHFSGEQEIDLQVSMEISNTNDS